MQVFSYEKVLWRKKAAHTDKRVVYTANVHLPPTRFSFELPRHPRHPQLTAPLEILRLDDKPA